MALAPLDQSSSPAAAKPASSSENRAVESSTTTTSQPVVGASSGTSPSHGQEATEKTLTSPKVAEREASKQEDASVSATVTSSQPDSSKKKAQTSPATTTTKSANTRSSKPSKFSNLLRKLVPCIPSPPKAQAMHADDVGNGKSVEKQQPKASKAQPATAATPPISTTPSKAEQAPATNGNGQTPSPATAETPTVPADVVVPVTPTTHLLPKSETEGMTSGAVVPPGATGSATPPSATRRHSNVPSTNGDSDGTSFSEEEEVEDVNNVEEIEDEEERLIMSGGAGIPIGPDGVPKPLLPPLAPHHAGRKCLVLDLDETLVHSSFKSIQQADYVVPVEIEYHWHNVYVIKRPGVDNFLKKMGEIYEVVVFTASLSKYADPVLDKLDIHQVVGHRLFRESCYNHRGNYVKDLSQLGRPIADTIILDNSPASYIFHPNNAVPVSSWFNDPHDTELTDLVPFLTDLATSSDVRGVLDGAR